MLLVAAVGAPFLYEGSINRGGQLTISDVNGTVRVRTGDRLTIHATRTATNSDPNAVAIRVDTRGDGIVVCVRYPPEASRHCNESSHSSSDNDTRVDFDVTIPSGVALDARTINGEVDAHSDGRIDATAVNGRVSVEGADVRRVSTVNGPLSVRVTGRATRLNARTVNGSIDVTVPSDMGFTLTAHTVSGDIDLPGANIVRPAYGPGASATAKLGDGSARIVLDTVNGTIRLRH